MKERGVDKMELSNEMLHAWEFVENTGTSVFLTGKAGTGKTTFLRYVTRHTAKTCVVTAPTGVAAINAGGVTLHSFFQLPLTPYVPGTNLKSNYKFSKEKLRMIRALDLLVIDEISMVRSDLLDSVDATLRRLRGRVEPFGGVQLLLIGDLQQLAPVVTRNDEELLRGYYSTPYFFGSRALERTPYVTIGLHRVFRQQNPEFLQLLNHVRSNRLTPEDHCRLSALWNPDFEPRADEGYIRLTTHNRQADRYNDKRLLELPGKKYTFNAVVDGNFPETSFPTDSALTLKEGAQVMFIKNDSAATHRFYNGKIGRVVSLDNDHVAVECVDDGEVVDVEPMIWENTRYEVNETTSTIEAKVEGTFSQLPLRLAWAITIHKSQGLTFSRAVIDAGQAFAPGQVYVALSRCRSLAGLVLATPLRGAMMMADPEVLAYISGQTVAAEKSAAALEDIRKAYRRSLLGELFSFNLIGEILYRMRVFAGERLGKAGKPIADMLAESDRGMKQSLTDVAVKWKVALDRMTEQEINSEVVRARIENGIAYFLRRLCTDVIEPLQLLEKVKPGNKAVAARWKELYDEFTGACRFKLLTLETMAGKPFTTAAYLDAKRKAVLQASKSDHKKSSPKVKVIRKNRPKI